MTQKANVLAHLRRYGTITPLEALQHYGCFRLAAVIHVLRGEGHTIETRDTPQTDGADFATYVLRQAQGELL